MPTGRVCIAFDDNALTVSPTWTRIDDTDNLVKQIEISRGRQTEFDKTETGTATILVNDTAGLFDPSSTVSPYYGKLDGKQIAISLYNPVGATWVQQYRGFIDSYGWEFDPAEGVAYVRIDCVDAFDYLAGCEMYVDSTPTWGTTPPSGSEGNIFYANGNVDDRIIALLADANWPSGLSQIFTGNVTVQDTVYDPGEPVLNALRDAADAEFPGIANLYVDKSGTVCFHGRKARFDPDTVSASSSWNFRRWKAGNGAAITGDSAYAQIRPPLSWSRPRSRIVNAALSYPRGMAETGMAHQIATDSSSITSYGYRSWSSPDLITLTGTTTGNAGTAECKAFAQYYVNNYAQPHTRVENLTLRSINSTDSRASATWGLICGADISDVIHVKHGYPSGVGLDADFYVEGIQMTILPANTSFDDVTVTYNVSPSAYYGSTAGLF